MESVRALPAALYLFCLSTAVAVSAGPLEIPSRITAEARGQIIEAPGTDARAEVVTFGESLTPALLRIAPEQTVRVAGWPVAPGTRADVRLTRFEIYSPEARIWKVEGDRRTEVPRSRMAFFRGLAEDAPDTRVFVGVDPDTGQFQGLALSPAGSFEIRPYPAAAQGRGHLVTVPEYFLPEKGGKAQPLSWTCGQSGAEQPLDFLDEKPAEDLDERSPIESLTGRVLASLHVVTVAVDTDNELMQQKFSDNTTNAANYVAALIAAMNVIYERDLNIRLLQGETFLRVSTSADPYAQTGSGASSAQLNEFSNYWSANYSGVSRGLAMLLSGKSSNSNSSSGIAWLTGLCSTSIGYSFSQVFKFNGATGSTDAFVVGHELGHNFGSPHTHCYSPTIDNCYNLEGGCYSGATSCPAATTINGVTNVKGTLMSYCHLLGGCTASNVFHSRTVDLITSVITPRIGNCVFPSSTVPTVSAVSPAQGPTSGGTVVTITGTNFQNGATVKFGTSAAASVTFNSSTQLTVTTPAQGAGTVGVTVTVAGVGYAVRPRSFTFVPPPTVSTVSPASGSTVGGTSVTITGSDFQNGAMVSFGGTPAASVTFNSSTQLTATSPAHAAGTVGVTVTNPDTQNHTKTNAFTFIAPPAISGVSPNLGAIAGGLAVVITGTDFQNGATVSFGGTAATLVVFNSPTQLTATNPARAAGIVHVVVTNPDGQSDTETNAFTYVDVPLINSLSPNNGTTAGGSSVTINGANFQNGATVDFGGTSVAVTFNSSTSLTVTSPAHATGSVSVTVTNPDTSAATKTNAFFYTPPPVATDLYTLTPCRVLDTRLADGPSGGPVLGALAERSFPVTGICGVPSNAVAAVFNVTVTGPTSLGYVTVFPGNAFALGTSVLNFTAGKVVANNAVVLLATDGSGTIRILNGSSGTTHVVVDVTGYYAE